MDMKGVLNDLKVNVSLAQLLDASPAVRAEAAKLMKLQVKEKGTKPAKRVRVSATQSAKPSRKQQLEPSSKPERIPIEASLFFAESVIEGLSEHGDIRKAKARYTLIDCGSEGNLVPRHVVEALKAKTESVHHACEMASGQVVHMTATVCLIVSIMGISKTIHATVVEGEPGYTILLGRHWMYEAGVEGNYRLGKYWIDKGNGERLEIPRSINLRHLGMGDADVKVSKVSVEELLSSSSEQEDIVVNYVDSPSAEEIDKELLEVIHEAIEDSDLSQEYEADSESSEN